MEEFYPVKNLQELWQHESFYILKLFLTTALSTSEIKYLVMNIFRLIWQSLSIRVI